MTEKEEMASWDKNVVDNIRRTHGEKVSKFSDQHLLDEWTIFSQSDVYEGGDAAFLEWLDG